MLSPRPPRVLSIAGLDPSGGAGLVADAAAVRAAGGHPLLVAAALTAQGDAGVRGVLPVPAEFVTAQVSALGPPPDAAKLGMLATAETVRAVADLIDARLLPPPVLDPVLRSTSGHPLLDPTALPLLVELLLPRCAAVTPNVPEAESLTGVPCPDLEGMARAARRLRALGAPAVLLTGGHLPGDLCADLLLAGDDDPQVLATPRRPGTRRGTGCRHASYLATALARGLSLRDAARAAQEHVASLFDRS